MASGDTAKFGLIRNPDASPPSPADFRRLEKTVVDLRGELDEWVAMQKRGNKISLEVQGEVQVIRKEMKDGFKYLKDQNDQIMKLLKKLDP